MQNHKKYKIAFILVVIIIILLSFTLFLYIKAPIFFKPNHKVIQYQEEVKLSNGEMIWVDIKRHYRLTGGAPGDGSMLTGHYLPSIVEISWDTGFEGVGRMSFRSDVGNSSAIFVLDRDISDNYWYIIASKNSSSNIEGITLHNNSIMKLFTIDKNGRFIIRERKNIQKLYRNVMVYDIDNDSMYENQIQNGFTWQSKIDRFNNDGLSIGNEVYPKLVKN